MPHGSLHTCEMSFVAASPLRPQPIEPPADGNLSTCCLRACRTRNYRLQKFTAVGLSVSKQRRTAVFSRPLSRSDHRLQTGFLSPAEWTICGAEAVELGEQVVVSPARSRTLRARPWSSRSASPTARMCVRRSSADLAGVLKQLGPDGDRVQVLFVTGDPERDTAGSLAKYVTAFDPRFIGLRATRTQRSARQKTQGLSSRSARPATATPSITARRATSSIRRGGCGTAST